MADAAQVAKDEAQRLKEQQRARAAETRHWRQHAATGADQPGAVVHNPVSLAAIEPKSSRWDRGQIFDASKRLYLTARKHDTDRWQWMIHEDFGNYALLLELHGTAGKGFRPGYGLTTAFVVEHAHTRSFFPFSDTLYADALPLERIAQMINLHPGADDVGNRVIVDNREAFRSANAEAAILESAPRLRLYPQFQPQRVPGPPVDFWSGSPDPAITYDVETRRASDARSGLSLTLVGRGGPEPYSGATVRDAIGDIEHFPVEVVPCHRPDYGETSCITMQEPWAQLWGYSREKPQPPPRRVLTREQIAPLLNVHPGLFLRECHVGHAAILDRRVPWHPDGRF
jgi:hypothetical protein